MANHLVEKSGLSFWDVVTSPKARKFQLAAVGVILSAATGGLLPAPVAVWVILIINTMVAYGVFQVPNAGQTLVLQPAGTSPETADVVIETPASVEPMVRGNVVG